MNLKLILASVAVAVAAASCGGSAAPGGHQAEIDAEAYDLGVTHGRLVARAMPDTARVCDMLLDVRTRESDFRNRFGAATADSYVAGFEDAVKTESPELANSIF